MTGVIEHKGNDNMKLDRRDVLQSLLLLGAVGKTLAAQTAHPAAPPLSRAKLESLFVDLPSQSPLDGAVDVYAATALSLSRLAASTTRCQLDIPYGKDPWQKLDIYLPAQQKLTGLPVFLNIHGGGWTHGYKEWMGLNAPPLVALPAIYISIGYRLAPASRHPAQLEDCFNALAWVHGHIAEFGGSPDRLFIGGHSAGAHLAALITLRHELYGKFGLPANVIKACFPYNGIYDLRNVEIYGESPEKNPGVPLLAAATAAPDASPLTFVKGNRTPFLVTWAENDGLLIKAESSTFVAALKEQPGRVAAHMLPRFDHFWSHIDQQRAENPWTQTLCAWMAGDPSSAAVAFS
jgi:arylformamidase